VISELTDFHTDRLARLWHAHLLQEDEDLRSDGLSDSRFWKHGERQKSRQPRGPSASRGGVERNATRGEQVKPYLPISENHTPPKLLRQRSCRLIPEQRLRLAPATTKSPAR